MKLHDQRDTLTSAAIDAASDVRSLIARIHRKIAAPYGDGSRSNMVNAETDVLPALREIALNLDAALERVSYE